MRGADRAEKMGRIILKISYVLGGKPLKILIVWHLKPRYGISAKTGSQLKARLDEMKCDASQVIKMQGKNGLFTPPTYSHIYNLKTVQMSNDKGTWFGWDVTKVGPVTDKNIYDMAKNFATSVGKGEVQTKPEVQEQTKKTLNLYFNKLVFIDLLIFNNDLY